LFVYSQFAFSALTSLVGKQERHLACKITRCWYSVDGDLTGALHVLELWFAPLPPAPLSVAALKVGMVCYSDTVLHCFFWISRYKVEYTHTHTHTLVLAYSIQDLCTFMNISVFVHHVHWHNVWENVGLHSHIHC